MNARERVRFSRGGSQPPSAVGYRIGRAAQLCCRGRTYCHGARCAPSTFNCINFLRDALLLELRGLNRSAAAIAEEDGTPDIMNRFRMPYGVSDVILAARAFADAAQPLTAKFEALGHEPTLVVDLEAHVAAFESADADQNPGVETQASATANFDALLREALVNVKSLDAMVHNFYKSSASKLGAWKTASHAERQAKTKKSAPAPASIP